MKLTSLFFFFALVTINGFTQSQRDIETIIQSGHHDVVTAVQYSPDGTLIASGSKDKTIRLWEVATGRELRVMNTHEYTIRSIKFDSKGERLICGSNDGGVSVWDIKTGQLIKYIQSSKNRVTSVAINSFGNRLVSGGYDWETSIWDLSSTEEPIKKIKVSPAKGTGEGIDVKYSSDDMFLAIGEDNYTAEVFSTDSFKLVAKLRLEDGGYCGGCATQVTFSNDNQFLYTASSKKGIFKWNISTAKITQTYLEGRDRVSLFDVNENNGIMAYGHENELKIVSLKNGTVMSKIDLDSIQIRSVDISDAGDEIALGCDDSTVKIYTTNGLSKEKELKGLIQSSAADGLEYNRNSMWDAWIIKYITQKSSMSLSPDGNFLAKGKIGKTARLIELRTGRIAKEFTGHEKMVLCTRFSSDGKWLLTGGAGGKIFLWDVVTGKVIKEFKGHIDPIFDLQFNSTNTQVLSASWDGSARLWDVESGEMVKKYRFQNKAPFALQFVMNDLYFLAANLDGKTRLIEMDTGEEINLLIGHNDKVQSLGLSPNKDKVVTASWDGLAKVWGIKSGYQEVRFGGHDGSAHAAVFSSSGNWVASGDAKGQTYIWDSKTGHVLYKLSKHKSAVNTVLFTDDDHYLITGSIDGEMKVWDMNNRMELYSYHTIGTGDWIVTTPHGLFDATKNARKYIFFVNELKSYSIDQFFDEFYQPGLIRHLYSGLDLNSEDRSIRDRVVEFPPPEIKIEFPKPGAQLKPGINEMMVTFRDAGGGIDELRVMHNGKRIPNDTKGLGRSPKKGNVTRKIFKLDIVPGLNTISVSAYSKGRVESRPVVLHYNIPSKDKKGKCHVLAIGVNKYKNSKFNLNYAKDDAQSFVKAIREETDGLFSEVIVHELYNENATKRGILDKLDQIAVEANTEDVFVFYYAGHGSMMNQEFYFVTNEITRLYDQTTLEKEALNAVEVQEVFKHIKALKQVVILDACHSGGSTKLLATRGGGEEKAIAQLSRSSGVHVFASAGSDQFAVEFKKLGHGVFTYLLIKALKGEADGAPADGRVTIFELKSYLDSKVPELSEEMKGTAQYPYTFSIGNDFPISLKR